MITAGVDVGLKNIKVVILDDGKIVAKGIGKSEGVIRPQSIEAVWSEALAEAGLKESDIVKTVATGQGKYDVDFADKNVTDVVAIARGARWFFPEAAFVMDAGADQTRIAVLGEGNEVKSFVTNQKCMAGLGLLLDIAADRLGMTIDGISALPQGASAGTVVNDGCPVFAEQGMLELLNDGAEKEKIAGAIVDMVAIRLQSILNDKEHPGKHDTVLFGGVAKNKAVVCGLESLSGIEFLIPEEAEYGAAAGAAVIAAD